MRPEELIQVNIENLIALWTACGIKDHALQDNHILHRSVNWPWRMWLDYNDHPSRQALEHLSNIAEMSDGPVMIPQWHETDQIMGEVLSQAGFKVSLTQQAMVASLDTIEARQDNTLQLRRITNIESTGRWTAVASGSFGYDIHDPVIAGLVGAPDIHLLLAYVDHTVVGTGLLLQTNCAAGLHMVGVLPDQRRKGYARRIMCGLLWQAQELGCEHATLQASAAGEALYQQLGFKAQGSIRSYRKKPSSPSSV